MDNTIDADEKQDVIPVALSEEEILIKGGESSHVEFKSTLRWNRKANLADTRVERGCLKTIVAFLNSEGGTLLIGVQDGGNILGIEADHFENEDKFLLHFANLIKERIGTQSIHFIQSGLKEVNGKKIFRVDCSPSSSAVFYKGKDGEEFFIRNGPSSEPLPTSEVLEYSKKHFRR